MPSSGPRLLPWPGPVGGGRPCPAHGRAQGAPGVSTARHVGVRVQGTVHSGPRPRGRARLPEEERERAAEGAGEGRARLGGTRGGGPAAFAQPALQSSGRPNPRPELGDSDRDTGPSTIPWGPRLGSSPCLQPRVLPRFPETPSDKETPVPRKRGPQTRADTHDAGRELLAAGPTRGPQGRRPAELEAGGKVSQGFGRSKDTVSGD